MMDLDAIEQPSHKHNWFMLILKIIFVIAAMVLIGITIMANMGGAGETLKKSVEGFIYDNTPFEARIGRFNGMTFYPNISFDFEDTEFYPHGSADAVMSLDSFQTAFSFWDVMISSGKIKKFDLKNLRALSGALLDTPVMIESAAIVESDAGPRFEIKGSINNKPISLISKMKAEGQGKSKKYSFGPIREFDFHFAGYDVTGKMVTGDNGVEIQNLELTTKGKKVADGTLNLERGRGRITIGGHINMADHTDLAPGIEIDRVEHKTTGTIKSAEFHANDFARGSAYDNLMNTIDDLFSKHPTPENVNLTLDAASVIKGDASQGPYKGPLPLTNWRVDTTAITPKAP